MKKVLHSLVASTALLLTLASATLAQGSLSALINPTAGTTVNLTAEGVLDWSHWGINNLVQDHKAVSGAPVGLISDQTLVGVTGSGAYGDNRVAYTWTDGTPTATATDSTTGIYEAGGSFTFTAPAGTAARLLKVYVGGVTAGTTFTAHLSDGSAPDYTDSTLNSAADVTFAPDGNHFYGVYTILYKAASASQTLTITYTQTAGSGNITLQAATLQVAPTTPPAAPTNLVATAGTNRIGLTWKASAGATSYNVKSSASATGTFTTIASNLTTTSYQDFTAVNGVKTFYVVTANNIIGESGPSNVASATPQPGIDGTGIMGAYYNSPDVPNPKYLASQLILTELDPQVNFNVDGTRPANVPHDNIGVIWTGAIKAPVTGAYVFTTTSDDGIRLYLDGNLAVDDFIYQGTTVRNASPVNWTAGSIHTVRVVYFQGGGGGLAQLSWSFPGQATQLVPTYALFPDASLFAPPAPTLAGVPAGPTSVNLLWGQPDNAVTYNLLRATTSGAETLYKTGLTGGTYTDTGLTSGTTYYYVLQAVNPKGTSPNSNEVAVAPTAPIIGNGVGLAGTYYAGDNPDFTIAEATTPILNNIAPTVNYTFNNPVQYNPNPFPAELSSVTTNLEHFTAVWSGQVQAPYTGAYTFQTVSDDGSQLSLDTGSGYQIIVNNNRYQGPTAVTSSPINLLAGQKYNIKMEYYNGTAGATAQLLYNPLNSGLIIIPQTQLYPVFTVAPAAPTNLTAGGGDGVVNLNWTVSQYAATYNVLRATKTGGPYTTIATGIVPTSYADTTAKNGTTYYYVVQSVNNIATSGNSNEASATPAAAVVGNGDGLAGVYYAGGAFNFSAETTTPIFNNIAPTVNYNYNNTGVNYNPTPFPDGLIALIPTVDNFTTVWSGQVLAPSTGSYRFQTITDDAARLTIDTDTATGVVLFDDENGHGPLANTGAAVTLTAGKKYNIKFEFVQGGGGGTAQLLYSAVGADFQIIPQSQLFSGQAIGATVKGTIALEGVPDLSAVPSAAPLGKFDIQFRTPGTATIITENKNVTLTTSAGSAKGSYSISGPAAGTYDVWIKGSKNLAVLVPNVVVSATTGTVANVLLPAADANNDNSVDTSDFGVLVGGYNGDSTIPGSGYDPLADFNFDGVVDTNDFALLVGEYNNVGAN